MWIFFVLTSLANLTHGLVNFEYESQISPTTDTWLLGTGISKAPLEESVANIKASTNFINEVFSYLKDKNDEQEDELGYFNFYLYSIEACSNELKIVYTMSEKM